MTCCYGALAQLGERYTGSVEVIGSIPTCSTKTVDFKSTVFSFFNNITKSERMICYSHHVFAFYFN